MAERVPYGRHGFHCEVVPDGTAARLVAMGELDMASAGELDRELGELARARFETVVLDLSGVSFMDSSGLAVIVRHCGDGRPGGHSIGIVPGPPAVQRVFELCCLVDRLPFLAPPAQAIQGDGGAAA